MQRIVFVCLHGSAKSVIAASYCRRLAERRGLDVVAESAGLEPDAAMPPRVVNGLAADGFDLGAPRPRALKDVDLRGATAVVAFGCDVPAAGDVPVTRWDDVPAVNDDFGKARDAIVAHVERLVSGLAPDR